MNASMIARILNLSSTLAAPVLQLAAEEGNTLPLKAIGLVRAMREVAEAVMLAVEPNGHILEHRGEEIETDHRVFSDEDHTRLIEMIAALDRSDDALEAMIAERATASST